jgi:DNA-binding ferritin-like protein (Dps family)
MADIVNILTLVLKAMVSVECLIKLSGDDKKRFVITLLEKQLPNYNDDYREIVPMIIELVIILSKTKIPINIKKLKMCCNLQ